MKRNLRLLLSAAVSSGLIFGCAAPEPAYTPSPFTPVKIDTSGYIAKVEAFAVIVDASTSMGGDRPYKFLYEKDLAGRLNQTIPPMSYQASLIAFGAGKCVKDQMAWQVTGPSQYNESEIAGGIGAVKCTSGWSPLESAIDKSGEVLAPVAGHSALVIFSDFKKLEAKAVTASAKKLKDSMGARLCIHPVQVGNDPGGKALADELAAIGGCGPAVNADSIASGPGGRRFGR
jgi:OOP family OmpA-OmpF porin